MAQAQVARITCSLCSGWYISEREFRDHMQTVHRRFAPNQIAFQSDFAQQDGSKNQLGASKEEWARLSVRLRNRVRERFNQEELEAIDRFILVATHGSIFEDMFR